MTTWSSMPGRTSARSSAARAALAPRSIADTPASAPPFCPSPRLPPTHSAIGVRAPERMTMSGSPLLDKVLLLASKVVDEADGGSPGRSVAGGDPRAWGGLRCGTLAPVAGGDKQRGGGGGRRGWWGWSCGTLAPVGGSDKQRGAAKGGRWIRGASPAAGDLQAPATPARAVLRCPAMKSHTEYRSE